MFPVLELAGSLGINCKATPAIEWLPGSDARALHQTWLTSASRTE